METNEPVGGRKRLGRFLIFIVSVDDLDLCLFRQRTIGIFGLEFLVQFDGVAISPVI